MRTRLAAFAIVASMASAPALACGFCVEDRVAAVYDQKVVDAAVARRQQVAFFAVEGAMTADAAGRRAVAEALEASGAARGSARVAIEDGACSAAFDPARIDAARLAAGAARRLAARGVTLTPLRVTDPDGKLREP